MSGPVSFPNLRAVSGDLVLYSFANVSYSFDILGSINGSLIIRSVLPSDYISSIQLPYLRWVEDINITGTTVAGFTARLGPLTVGIDAHGSSLYRDVQNRAQAKLEELYARL